MDNAFRRAAVCFGETLANASDRYFDTLSELRIRADKPVVAYLLNTPYFVASNGELTSDCSADLLRISFDELKNGFVKLCAYSVYKHIGSMSRGFITLAGGHRVGVCGAAVLSGGEVTSVCDVTSLNIRAAKEFPGCSRCVTDGTDLRRGALICGAPSSGKTTLLRDLARTLSLEKLGKVCVIDERYEIAACFSGRPGFDVGLSDIYSGYPKKTAVELAVRTMSPEYIICDELTGEGLSGICDALNCGVSVIATSHCGSAEEAADSANVKALLKTGAFQSVIFLDGSLPPRISKICAPGEI